MRTEKNNHRRSVRRSYRLVNSSLQVKDEKSKRELDRRLEYLRAFFSSPSDAASVKLLISEVAFRRKESPPPSPVTVRRWAHLYCLNGNPMTNGRPLFGKTRERALKSSLIYEE